ncbi:MAG: succinyldiaminopimelate transaminase [Burkholderiales bacterium]
MNRALDTLQPYPFAKLRDLFARVTPNPAFAHISLGIGEPKHPTPALVKNAITANLSSLASYPPTAGSLALRAAISRWLERRYAIPKIDEVTQVLPVNGSREALFAFAQTVVERRPGALIVCPNPFYQIYEGAALLAGAQIVFANMLASRNFRIDYGAIPAVSWQHVQLLYCCSPSNPTGMVLNLEDWRELFALSDKYGFVIASDECYSEIYFDESRPPIGALEAAHRLGRPDFKRLVVFSSLSKRSNAPGMRSGFVAGDAAIIDKFLLYRTYHGSAMSPPYQAASVIAWGDELHVRENRAKYAQKFREALPLLAAPLETQMPDAGFYFWVKTPITDTEFARRLYAERHVTVLPGSYLAREAMGVNPGAGYIRLALVAEREECIEGIARLADFARSL